MKRHYLFTLAAAMLLVPCLAVAASDAHRFDDTRIIPVLVHVNKAGEVTQIQLAYDLRPAVKRAVEKTVTGMIGKPATKNGQAVRSQFILVLELKPVEQSANQYKLAYVSAKPVPFGNWHWVHNLDGHGRGGLQLVGDRDSNMVSSPFVMLPCGNNHDSPICVDPSNEPRSYDAF